MLGPKLSLDIWSFLANLILYSSKVLGISMDILYQRVKSNYSSLDGHTSRIFLHAHLVNISMLL